MTKSLAAVRIAVLPAEHRQARAYLDVLRLRPDVDIVPVESPDVEAFAAVVPDAGHRGDRTRMRAVLPDALVAVGNAPGTWSAVVRAAAAGVPVWCDSSVNPSPGQLAALADQPDAARVVVVAPISYSSLIGDLRSRVHARQLGDVLSAHCSYRAADDQASEGLLSYLAEMVWLLDDLVDCDVAAVRAIANTRLPVGTALSGATAIHVTLTYVDGATATIECSWGRPFGAAIAKELDVDVIGTRGTVEVRPFGQRVHGADANGSLELPMGDDLFAAAVHDLVQCVQGGGAPPMSLDRWVRVAEIVDTVRQSVAVDVADASGAANAVDLERR